MEPKKSKYDTNPLDPDFVKNAQEEWTGDESRGETSEVGDRATREIRGAASEEIVSLFTLKLLPEASITSGECTISFSLYSTNVFTTCTVSITAYTI